MGTGDGTGLSYDLGPHAMAEALALNNAHVRETSLLDAAGLQALLGMAWWARGIDGGSEAKLAALLIALDQDAAYENPNFAWFQRRYERFVYIDRVMVTDAARGRGIARRLYEELFAAAQLAGHTRVVCEVNVHPPNAASDAFHAAMGFEEIGRAVIYGGAKTVRYFERVLG